MIRRIAALSGAVVVGVAILWGLRLIILEGFLYPWPHGFAADFFSMMFTGEWDGSGIVYGPIFVIERWLVEAFPRAFTMHTFAIANIFLAIGSFWFCVLACRATPRLIAVSLAMWVCYSRLTYAFTVAANPEFLELFFLSVAWFAASRRRQIAEGLFIAAAGLTKIFPWLLLFPMVVRGKFRGLMAAALLSLAVVLIVGTGQHLSPWQVIRQSTSTRLRMANGDYTDLAPRLFTPAPYSDEYVGILEATTRTVFDAPRRPLTPAVLAAMRPLFIGTVGLVLCFAAWATVRLQAVPRLSVRTAVALTYSVYFALLPVVNIFAHPHTFIFLLPLWVALPTLIYEESRNTMTRWIFSAWFGACYVLTGFPQPFVVIDRIFKTHLVLAWPAQEPMIGALLLLCGLGMHIKLSLSA